MNNTHKLLLVLTAIVLQGCVKGEYYEIADGRGVCVEGVEYSGDTVNVRSFVDNNLYMVERWKLSKTDKCEALKKRHANENL